MDRREHAYYPDNDFWLENVAKVKELFITAILPELMGKFYSRPDPLVPSALASQPGSSEASTSSPVSQEDSAQTYCLGQMKERWWDVIIQTANMSGSIWNVWA